MNKVFRKHIEYIKNFNHLEFIKMKTYNYFKVSFFKKNNIKDKKNGI